MTLKQLLTEFEEKKNPSKAKILSGFFKTGKGEYGDGDVFLGLSVPEQRELAKKYKHLDLESVQKLLSNKIHEHRLTSLIILTYKYEDIQREKTDSITKENKKKEIFTFYLKNTANINNWDLVDLSCHRIVGEYLLNKDRNLLYKLARSKDLWEKRISIVSTYTFIRKKEFSDTLKIAEILLNDKHDLIHKATGWMLREVGKKDEKTLKMFLEKHHKIMPRTALRYSIERLSVSDKKKYMTK
ncbi:MAG: DNA alkylation repair protein [Candidatus Nanoarchaeia archaeon]